MKSFTISCLITFTLITFSEFSQSQNIFANVNGDTVTLWETGANRNCGAIYTMEINIIDHQIDWYQVDTGLAAFCFCTFDLSVTYGPLEPGNYTVDVYYTFADELEEFYEGSTSFTIGSSRTLKDGGIISQYQSNCYLGLEDPESDNEDFRIFPVPLRNGEILNLEASPTGGKAILEIFTLTGELIYSKPYQGNQAIQDQWVKEELFPVSGIYLLRLKTDDQVYIKKITVL